MFAQVAVLLHQQSMSPRTIILIESVEQQQQEQEQEQEQLVELIVTRWNI